VEQAPCFNRFQSAYRRHHSTETAILRLLNDAYTTADNKSRTLLIQLDLSAAFDSIDHST
jgi:Reverse transcriptase (RNA-dependent DNA polymerase)